MKKESNQIAWIKKLGDKNLSSDNGKWAASDNNIDGCLLTLGDSQFEMKFSGEATLVQMNESSSGGEGSLGWKLTYNIKEHMTLGVFEKAQRLIVFNFEQSTILEKSNLCTHLVDKGDKVELYIFPNKTYKLRVRHGQISTDQ